MRPLSPVEIVGRVSRIGIRSGLVPLLVATLLSLNTPPPQQRAAQRKPLLSAVLSTFSKFRFSDFSAATTLSAFGPVIGSIRV
ncbi:MAG: hypothetical protein WBA25_05085 [Jannaschia sp.]